MLIIMLIASVVIIGSDQLIKYWAIHNLAGQGSQQFIKIAGKEIINLHYLENDGAVFGSFSGMRILLITLTSILLVACIFLMIKSYKKSKILSWSLLIISCGGIGNFIDRIFRHGKVIDYIEVRLFQFAIFNLADCFVTIGSLILIIYIIFFENRESSRALTQNNKHAGVKNE